VLNFTPKFSASSHSYPASHRRQIFTNFSNMSPSHGLQFLMNCLSMGPFHGVRSFRNRLLQHGSLTRSQALPANLLQHGLLSPGVHRSLARSLLQHRLFMGSQPTCSCEASCTGCRWISAPLWTSMDCRRWPTSLWAALQAAEESLLQCLEHLLPLLLP